MGYIPQINLYEVLISCIKRLLWIFFQHLECDVCNESERKTMLSCSLLFAKLTLKLCHNRQTSYRFFSWTNTEVFLPVSCDLHTLLIKFFLLPHSIFWRWVGEMGIFNRLDMTTQLCHMTTFIIRLVNACILLVSFLFINRNTVILLAGEIKMHDNYIQGGY